MSGVDTSCGILAHIRHAEGWLRRARADCVRGDQRQALLRLFLAEAEIRRARESVVPAAAPIGRRAAVPAWAVLGTVALAGVILAVYAGVKPPASGPIGRGPVAPQALHVEGRNGVLRFETGQVLPFVGAAPGIRQGGRTAVGNLVGVDGDPLLNNDDGPIFVNFR